MYNNKVFTVVETHEFLAQAKKVWSDDEREDFIDWIAGNPMSGDVIAGADGARKVRWSVQGKGKRGGARIIYFNVLDDGFLVLLAVYVKAEQTNIALQAVKGAKRGFKKD